MTFSINIHCKLKLLWIFTKAGGPVRMYNINLSLCRWCALISPSLYLKLHQSSECLRKHTDIPQTQQHKPTFTYLLTWMLCFFFDHCVPLPACFTVSHTTLPNNWKKCWIRARLSADCRARWYELRENSAKRLWGRTFLWTTVLWCKCVTLLNTFVLRRKRLYFHDPRQLAGLLSSAPKPGKNLAHRTLSGVSQCWCTTLLMGMPYRFISKNPNYPFKLQTTMLHLPF